MSVVGKDGRGGCLWLLCRKVGGIEDREEFELTFPRSPLFSRPRGGNIVSGMKEEDTRAMNVVPRCWLCLILLVLFLRLSCDTSLCIPICLSASSVISLVVVRITNEKQTSASKRFDYSEVHFSFFFSSLLPLFSSSSSSLLFLFLSLIFAATGD